ncbi:hypothetical protein T07_2379 [Trichinella nelsoni]|uniref:Uncharacterized protein n=1 Tax=Trichinella nelsoni TaxID=6336 RepID=A0A0V0RN77_9BILA|nr:hypothetical protein T07_2379 [Trichinella nelsoni]
MFLQILPSWKYGLPRSFFLIIKSKTFIKNIHEILNIFYRIVTLQIYSKPGATVVICQNCNVRPL